MGLTEFGEDSIMLVIHAIERIVRGGQHARRLACDAGKSSAPFPTAAATAAETSFSSAQRYGSSDLTARAKFIPGTMFR